jgi:hypothetical protein
LVLGLVLRLGLGLGLGLASCLPPTAQQRTVPSAPHESTPPLCSSSACTAPAWPLSVARHGAVSRPKTP